jgi:outer membrane protein assembly factor BamB
MLCDVTELRDTARLAGSVLVVAGVLAVVAALFMPWSWRTWPANGHPGVELVVAIVTLGPVVSAGCAVVWWRSGGVARRGAPLWTGPLAPALGGAFGGLCAGLLALLAASNVDPDQGIRAGGPLAVSGCAALVLGWLLVVVVAGYGPVRWGAAPVAGTVVLLLAAGTATVATARWYSEDRFVRRHPAVALPPVDVDPPERLERERWHAAATGSGWTRIVGRYLLVAVRDGLHARDAVTGEARWTYRRTDLPVAAAGVTADDATAVVLYAGDGNALAVALDTATGQQRWERRYSGVYPTGWRLLSAGNVIIGAGQGPGLGTVVAFDAGTGALRWTWRAPADCQGGGELATAGDALAIPLRCRNGDSVVGLSTVDGKPRWEWRPQYGTGLAHGDDMTVRPVGDGFLIGYGEFPRTAMNGTPVPLRAPRSAVTLDGTTGTASARHPVPARFVSVAGRTALYLGTDATSVDLTTGKARWSRPFTEFAGWMPVAATELAGTGYLLLRGPAPEGVPAGDGGPLRVVALSLTTGETRADRPYSLGDDGCHIGGDGRQRCGRHTATMCLGPGLLIVTEQPVGTDELRLGALG